MSPTEQFRRDAQRVADEAYRFGSLWQNDFRMPSLAPLKAALWKTSSPAAAQPDEGTAKVLERLAKLVRDAEEHARRAARPKNCGPEFCTLSMALHEALQGWEEAGEQLLASSSEIQRLSPQAATVSTPTPEPLHLAPSSQSPVPRTLKQPAPEAIMAYRLVIVTGKSQKEVAEILSQECHRPINQGTISRWVKHVRKFVEAGNVLPDLSAGPNRKPMPIDPSKLELGRRRDRHAPQQRSRGNEDD